jgi:ATP phosphoribosyltransferase regulatory subunit
MEKESIPSALGNVAPLRSRKLNEIEGALRNVLAQYGYMEIFLPLYDYYDMLAGTVQDFKDENIIRFIDRNTGKSLVLRPDFTPQVCRYAANYMNGYPLPLRLGYRGRVFRNVNMDKGIKSEKSQVGCELFGLEEMTGDIELLLMAESGMKALGLKGYRYVIGDMKFNAEVLKLVSDREKLLTVLNTKNMGLLNKMLDQSMPADFLRAVPFAYGGREVIAELLALAPNDNIKERLAYIDNFAAKLIELGIDEKTIVFDAAECKGHDYYTGLTFEILHGGIGSRIGTGGRYDNLAGKFGFDVPACGMAFYIEEIISVDKPKVEKISFDCLVAGKDRHIDAEKLRNQGKTVLYIESEKDRDRFLDFYDIKEIL